MAIKDSNTFNYDFQSKSSANIDAHYGPWTSIDGSEETSYKSWRDKYGLSTIKEGTQIAIKPNASSEVTLKIYSKGVWKDVGGDMSTLDFDVEDTGGDVLDTEPYVRTTANQGLNPTQQTNARGNIGAASQADLTDLYDMCVKTGSYDQTIHGQKTFDNGIIVNASPIDTDFKGNVKVQGTLMYTKPNAGQEAVQSGVLMRDNAGNVYSVQQIPSSTRATNADDALRAEVAYKDGQDNVISATYAKKSELPRALSDLDNDEGFITSDAISGKSDKTATLSGINISESGGTYTLTGTKADGSPVSIGTINIASVTASGSYDSTNQVIELTIGSDTLEIPVGDLVSGLQTEITSSNKLPASLVSGLANVATTGNYNDLSNKLEIDNSMPSSGKLYDSAKIDGAYAHKSMSLGGYGIMDAHITTNSTTGQQTITLGQNTVTPALIDDTALDSPYKTWSISKMNNTFARAANTIATYGITDAKIEENRTTHVKTITLGNTTMNPVEIDDANTANHTVFSSNKIVNTFASKGRVDNIEAKLAGNVIFGFPGYTGGALTADYGTINEAVTRAGDYASNITLKYVDGPRTILMKYTGRNEGYWHTFGAVQYNFNLSKMYMYTAEVSYQNSRSEWHFYSKEFAAQ